MRIDPFEVEDKVPDEGEIEWAVKRLRNNRSGGASRMRAEHLKVWFAVGTERREGRNCVQGGGRPGGHTGGGVKLGEGRGTSADGVQVRIPGG